MILVSSAKSVDSVKENFDCQILYLGYELEF